MRQLSILLILSVFVISNCSPTYTVKFDEPKPETFTTPKLKTFLDNKEEIKVVLRTPDKADDVTEESTYNPIFNTIEKEFLKAGFIVRDRAIFNQIVDKSAQEINYSELQEQTDTDLIIELVDFSTKLPYTTNTYIDEGREKTFENNNTISYYGAFAEFRVVLLEDNQFAGSYKFNYAPCEQGCPIKVSQYGEPSFVEKKVEEEADDKPFQYVAKLEFERFMRNAALELISEMK